MAKQKITVPDIPSLEQKKPGFQPPEAPKVAKVDLYAAPEKKQRAIDYLSQLAGVKPDAEKEAETERNIQRKERIANLTGAFKLLASAHYANKGYHVPRATPDRYLAKTQAELLRQKSIYDKDLGAYNARKAAVGSRMLSMQQTADIAANRQKQAANIETGRQKQADKRATERISELEKNRESLNTYRKGQLTNQKDKTAAYVGRTKTMEKLGENRYKTLKNGDIVLWHNGRQVSITKDKIPGIIAQIAKRRKELGLPVSPLRKTGYGDLKSLSNINDIGLYILNNFGYSSVLGGKNGALFINQQEEQPEPPRVTPRVSKTYFKTPK